MIYVTLTTIPQRVKNLHKSVESILSQTKKPDKIFINIPNNYKRFSETIESEQIPKFKDKRVEIVRCDDYGPGTKLLGSLEKLNKNSLTILVDDDHIYEDYMIEKFYQYYLKSPEHAYSFYVHPLGNFGVGQGADGFAFNSNFLDSIKFFYDNVVRKNKDLFIHDDLWISFFLFFVKKVKILSLQSQLKKNLKGESLLIYKKHIEDDGLITSYGKNINDAIKNRDLTAVASINYMLSMTKKIKF